MQTAGRVVGLTLAALTFAGCGLVSVDMTSTPPSVRYGDPVTFNIKLTNQSQCPVGSTVAMLIPFISASELNQEFSQIPQGAPPEVVEFFQALHDFIDQLCAGGNPMLPTPPLGTAPFAAKGVMLPRITTSCRVVGGAVECEFSGKVQSGNGMSFPLLGDRLQCAIDDFEIHCDLRIELQSAPAASGLAKAAITPLTCATPEQLGIPTGEFGAICFLGSFPDFAGLPGGQMAGGQVVLPARGTGVTLNLVIAISPDAEDSGVCKGGGNVGQACELGSSDCTGSSCGEGICINGTNPGNGCDVATQLADCGTGGTCTLCTQTATADFLPVDCTTTYISPEPAPVMSALALAGLIALLLATGTLWLKRRRGRG